jgi:hypothetical protein
METLTEGLPAMTCEPALPELNAHIPAPPVAPAHVRYIKLGTGGKWARQCFERGELHFGDVGEPHDLCLAGDWDGARRYMIDVLGRSPGPATDALREMRDFYELPDNTLWVTFFGGSLWWTLSHGGVADLRGTPGDHGAVMRNTQGWSHESRLGSPLRTDLLSTRLSKVAAYQKTICKIEEVDYLLRRINDMDEPSAFRGRQALHELVSAAEDMIPRLHEREFELLADLMLGHMGWSRISTLGGSMPDVDLVVAQPATGERAFVQVKSRATQAVLDDYIARFAASGLDRMFFICHSPIGRLTPPTSDRIHVWANRDLATKVNTAGLFEWLIERVS